MSPRQGTRRFSDKLTFRQRQRSFLTATGYVQRQQGYQYPTHSNDPLRNTKLYTQSLGYGCVSAVS